ncbi:hypothetical protein [Ferviditalea candida]|uniref:Uncharacterized protein n=1 Tax=Ferviditalea candida TaxID=3108399 RepID=A0ABU5ZPH4_9BACL|nr:hypothetical protein [Paenibacillaceae bacterium T2]
MQLIFPLEENVCKQHVNQTLYAVTGEGREYTGVLSRVEDGKLYFNDGPQEADTLSNRNKKKKTRAKTKAAKTMKPSNIYQTAFPVPVQALPQIQQGSPFSLDIKQIVYLFNVSALW